MDFPTWDEGRDYFASYPTDIINGRQMFGEKGGGGRAEKRLETLYSPSSSLSPPKEKIIINNCYVKSEE